MSKFEVSFSDTAITFVNSKTQKAEKADLFEVMDDQKAFNLVKKEINGQEGASRGAVSLLYKIITNTTRLDAYRGKTPVNESAPSEVKAVLRELEGQFFRPMYPNTATGEKEYGEFMGKLKAGGSYATAKNAVVSYFAKAGKTPIYDNGKLLTVAAINKLLSNMDRPENPKLGIAGKLVVLALEVKDFTDKTDFGDLPTGIAALKGMLATFEGLHREQLERLTAAHGIVEQAKNVTAKAKEPKGTGQFSRAPKVDQPALM
jgi:hypothetical protein